MTPTPPGTRGELKPCPFCGNMPYSHECEEMSSPEGLEVICLYTDCAIAGIGINREKWQARTPERKDELPSPEWVQEGDRAAERQRAERKELPYNFSMDYTDSGRTRRGLECKEARGTTGHAHGPGIVHEVTFSEKEAPDEDEIKEVIRQCVSLVCNTNLAAVKGMIGMIFLKIRPHLAPDTESEHD